MGIKVDEAHDKGGDSLRDRIRYLHPENLHPRYFFDWSDTWNHAYLSTHHRGDVGDPKKTPTQFQHIEITDYFLANFFRNVYLESIFPKTLSKNKREGKPFPKYLSAFLC